MPITNLPINPQNAPAQLGKDFLISVNTGTVEAPIWSVVGGQRSTALNRSADEIDASNKATSGWKTSKAGLRSWSMDAEAVAVLDNVGAEALEYAYINGLEINVQFKYPDGSYYSGWGSITDFSLETPHDDVATISATISGNGPLMYTSKP